MIYDRHKMVTILNDCEFVSLYTGCACHLLESSKGATFITLHIRISTLLSPFRSTSNQCHHSCGCQRRFEMSSPVSKRYVTLFRSEIQGRSLY